MREGHLIYQGPVKEALPYFNSIGFVPPKTMDAADFMVSVRRRRRRRKRKNGGGNSKRIIGTAVARYAFATTTTTDQPPS